MPPNRLTDDELATLSTRLPEWTSDGTTLSREFRFDDFAAALGFMSEVAEIAESLDHHPDWSNSWNRVAVSLTTHSAGGLTLLDLALAEAMDELAGRVPGGPTPEA